MNFPPPTPKQARVLWFCLTALAVAVLVGLLGFFAWGFGQVLHKLSGVLVPMIFALILAYILDPVVQFFENKGLRRIWSVTLVFTLAALLVVAALGSVLPGLRRENRKLIQDLPKISETVRTKLNAFLNDSSIGRQLPNSLRDTLQSAAAVPPASEPRKNPTISATPTLQPAPLTTAGTTTNASDSSLSYTESDRANPSGNIVLPGLTNAVSFLAKWLYTKLSSISTWAEFIIGFILVPVYLFYFLLEKNSIVNNWPHYLPLKPSRARDETVFVLRAINDCMIVFFRGQVLVALCVGTLLAIGYALLGLNYAVLLGLVAAVLGIVPYLGTVTSLLLALAVAAIQFQDWTHIMFVLGIAAGVKLVEDFVIGPRIIGERSGLHPLTIILAVLIGTTLMGGFLGAMLAIPLTAALRTLMFRYIWTREHPHARPGEIRRELEQTLK